jgi:hypothetical protein
MHFAYSLHTENGRESTRFPCAIQPISCHAIGPAQCKELDDLSMVDQSLYWDCRGVVLFKAISA